jgi:uncharacterized membrane protein
MNDEHSALWHGARQARGYLRNLFRPWKLVTFVMGAAFFVGGAYYWAVPTWDVGVSILMSVLCFLFAPWAVDVGLRACLSRKSGWIRDLIMAAGVVYMVASGSYEAYNTIRMGCHPVTYWLNLAFSIPVTIAAGLVWRYDGSVLDFVREVRSCIASGVKT